MSGRPFFFFFFLTREEEGLSTSQDNKAEIQAPPPPLSLFPAGIEPPIYSLTEYTNHLAT